MNQSLGSDPLSALVSAALLFLLYLVLGVLPACGVCYLFYFLLTLPLRRNERARLFLDLLDLGLKQGRAPDAAILGAASSRDRSLGARFHLLAAYLEQGLRLSQALKRVPRLLPPQVRAMLQTGERIGDLSKVLPACRELLKDGLSQVRGALNYVLVLALVITPLFIVLPIGLKVMILPKFMEVFAGVAPGERLPGFTRLVFGQSDLMVACQVGIFCLFWLLVLAYLGGPRLHGWLRRLAPGVSDWLLCRLPWRRKRLQRDFSALLAVLLDAEVPEVEAVTLAAEGTLNVVMSRRAATVCQRLKAGVKLPEAIRVMDDTGELHWRLSNALGRGGSFLRALAGWHEALAAKAFQLEQTAAQITTSCLVLFSGAIVACLVIGVFLVLIHLINYGCLW
ncbi:MAG: type II secretion system F family protein [Verrucomicrobiota bacterium]|jgi:general secretion pathway protein F